MGKRGEFDILKQVKKMLNMEREIENDNRGKEGRSPYEPRRKTMGGLIGIVAVGLVSLISLFPGCRGLQQYGGKQEIVKDYRVKKPKAGEVAGEGLVWIKRNNNYERIEVFPGFSFVKQEKGKLIFRDDNTGRLLKPVPLDKYETVEQRINAGEAPLKGLPPEQMYEYKGGKRSEAESWIQHILEH